MTPIAYGVEHPRGALLLVVASVYLLWLRRRRTRRLPPGHAPGSVHTVPLHGVRTVWRNGELIRERPMGDSEP